jgi:hypothetical protein
MLCLLLLWRKRKKKEERKKEREKWPGGFFPRAKHSLLAVPHGIFTALGAIKVFEFSVQLM